MSIDALLNEVKSDRSLREKLNRNPREVFEQYDVPAKPTIEVIDVKAGEIHLTIGGQPGSPVLQKILSKAASDAQYADQLKADPRAILEKEAGIELPHDCVIVVHDPLDGDKTRFFVPPFRSSSNGELSDSELASVAGGGLFLNIRNFFCRDSTTLIYNNQESSVLYHKDISVGPGTTESGSLIVW